MEGKERLERSKQDTNKVLPFYEKPIWKLLNNNDQCFHKNNVTALLREWYANSVGNRVQRWFKTNYIQDKVKWSLIKFLNN